MVHTPEKLILQKMGSIMKRLSLSVLSLVMCASAPAQSLTLNDGGISVIPADVTVNGIPVIGVIENRSPISRISLYDNDMEVSKVIDVSLEERISSCWNEVTDTLYPTKVVPGEPYLRPGFGAVWMPGTVILDSIPDPGFIPSPFFPPGSVSFYPSSRYFIIILFAASIFWGLRKR